MARINVMMQEDMLQAVDHAAVEEKLTTWARPDPRVYVQSVANYALSVEG